MGKEGLKEAIAQFAPQFKEEDAKLYGNGHINDTYRLVAKGQKPLILQRLNTYVFKQPEEVMENICLVTDYLRKQIEKNGGDPDRETLSVIRTVTGEPWYRDAFGGFWRCFPLIEGTLSYDRAETDELFYESALAFGRFQHLLDNFPAEKLHETIPHFHDTASRLRDLKKAAEEDVCGRAASVKEEIDFAFAHEDLANVLGDALARGELKLRVTHNDTKLNNVLMDEKTGKGICVVDLDTVMPGLPAHDFGDAVRFGASTADEDEPDVSKVHIDMDLYRVYLKGYLEGCGNSLTAAEIASLPAGAVAMAYELGMRFLTDYLQGDVYFKTAHENHNLERARAQFALAADMEKHRGEMLEAALCAGGKQ